jgi:hypothetical protein
VELLEVCQLAELGEVVAGGLLAIWGEGPVVVGQLETVQVANPPQLCGKESLL